jgi:hypothetical protein
MAGEGTLVEDLNEDLDEDIEKTEKDADEADAGEKSERDAELVADVDVYASDDDDDSDAADDAAPVALDALEAEELEIVESDESASMLVDEASEIMAIRRAEMSLDMEANAQRGDEFVCQSCFLVLKSSQLANKRKLLCVDCV